MILQDNWHAKKSIKVYRDYFYSKKVHGFFETKTRGSRQFLRCKKINRYRLPIYFLFLFQYILAVDVNDNNIVKTVFLYLFL